MYVATGISMECCYLFAHAITMSQRLTKITDVNICYRVISGIIDLNLNTTLGSLTVHENTKLTFE